MSLFRKIQSLKAQIVDTERLLEMVLDHPIMSVGISEKLNELKRELESLPKVSSEPKVQLLFSGNAVYGSQGIKSTFVSKTVTPFQEMIKTQFAFVRYGNVGKRGPSKKGSYSELYLTALPTGSFGVELSQLETSDLFAGVDVSVAMKQVISLITDTAKDDKSFESAIENTPKRNLSSLKRFLQEIAEEHSVLKIESGEIGIELANEKVLEAYQRVASAVDEEDEVFIDGIFRGLLLDSGRFEMQDEKARKLSGFISEDIGEDQLINYDKSFLNKNCILHLKVHKTSFKTGNVNVDYELLEIKER